MTSIADPKKDNEDFGHRLIIIDRIVDSTKDFFDNVIWGGYDTSLYTLESLEDGSEDIAMRLLMWVKRTFTGKSKVGPKKKSKLLSSATDVVGKDVKAIAMLGENTAVKATKEVLKEGSALAIIEGERSVKATKKVLTEGSALAIVGEETAVEATKEVLQTTEDLAIGGVKETKSWFDYFFGAKWGDDKPADRVDLHTGSPFGPHTEETPPVIEDPKKYIQSSRIYETFQKVANFSYSALSASSDFFYLAGALVLLGQFDFVLKNTYMTLLVALLIVFVMHNRRLK